MLLLYPFRVLPCVILFGLSAHLVYCIEHINGNNFKNISYIKAPIDSHKLGHIRQEKVYTEDVLNPVLQNYSALHDWLQGSQYAQKSPSFNRHPDDSRARRSTSLWCDGGNQCSLSLCPWRELVDAQHSRSPVNIKYAECLTTDCNYNFPGVSQFTKHILNVFTTCDVVRTDIRVVEHGRAKFITDWPIACLCTQHRLNAPVNGETAYLSNGEMSTDNISFDKSNIHWVQDVQNTEPRRPTMFRCQNVNQGGSRQRHLRRLYRLQQRRRQNTESFEEMMRRRQRENNHS